MQVKKTLADYFRMHIELENTASPYEAINFIRNERIKKSALQPILDKTEKLMLHGFEKIRPFVRHTISDNVFYYNSGNKDKNLLICFCGKANRLLMPIPVFLQYIDNEIYDVLILMDPSGLCFHSGIPEFGLTLEESIRKLSRLVSSGNHQQVITFGTSGGGCASLYVGIYLNAKKAISVGGRHPFDYVDTKIALSKKGLSGSEFDKLLSEKLNKCETNIQVIFANENNSDKKSAQTFLKQLINVNLLPVNDTDNHNVLEYLRGKQKLTFLLDDLFNQKQYTLGERSKK
jgi:hypothetical protein